MSLSIGDSAPDFSLPAIGGMYEEEKLISLKDFQGQRIVLFFYPRDLTPGCTLQGCDLRDYWKKIPEDVLVFGISTDSISKHSRFIEKYGFLHSLISDEKGEMASLYGVWKKKSLYGKIFNGIERTSFILDDRGFIEAIFPKVKPKEHIHQVLQYLNP